MLPVRGAQGRAAEDVCELGGWRNAATLLESYQKGDETTQRAALARRKKVCARGLTYLAHTGTDATN